MRDNFTIERCLSLAGRIHKMIPVIDTMDADDLEGALPLWTMAVSTRTTLSAKIPSAAQMNIGAEGWNWNSQDCEAV